MVQNDWPSASGSRWEPVTRPTGGDVQEGAAPSGYGRGHRRAVLTVLLDVLGGRRARGPRGASS